MNLNAAFFAAFKAGAEAYMPKDPYARVLLQKDILAGYERWLDYGGGQGLLDELQRNDTVAMLNVTTFLGKHTPEEIAKALGPPSMEELINDAAKATARFSDDELEEYAARHHCVQCGKHFHEGDQVLQRGSRKIHVDCVEEDEVEFSMRVVVPPPGHKLASVTILEEGDRAELNVEGLLLRECVDCNCLVVGGPTRCGRCVAALPKEDPNDKFLGRDMEVIDESHRFYGRVGRIKAILQDQYSLTFYSVRNQVAVDAWLDASQVKFLQNNLERTPDGYVNNCAIANGHEAEECQVCGGTCPDVGGTRKASSTPKKLSKGDFTPKPLTVFRK